MFKSRKVMFKSKQFIFIVFVFSFLFLSFSSVDAAEYNFTDTNTTAQFQSVIDNDTDDELVINLENGDYNFSKINVKRNATIKGKSSNTQINGSGILFNITSPNVSILNLTITNYNTAITSISSDLTINGNNINTKGISININSNSNDLKGIIIANNIIISANDLYGAVYVNVSDNNYAILDVYFFNNIIEGNGTNRSHGVYIIAKGRSSNLTFIKNNITGSSSYRTEGEGSVRIDLINNINDNITFTKNNITALSVSNGLWNGVALSTSNSSNSQAIFTNNNIMATFGDGVYIVSRSNHSRIIFADNNLTGTGNSNSSWGGTTGSGAYLIIRDGGNNSDISFTNNIITGIGPDSSWGIYFLYDNINNTNLTCINNIINGEKTGIGYYTSGLNLNARFNFTANNITVTNGSGFRINTLNYNNVTIIIADNNITGTANGNGLDGVYLSVYNSNKIIKKIINANITIVNNTMNLSRLGGSYSSNSVNLWVENIIGLEATIADNNFTGDSSIYVRIYNSSDINLNFTNNLIDGGVDMRILYYNNNLQVTFNGNILSKVRSGMSLGDAATDKFINNSQFTFTNNKIIGAGFHINLNGSKNIINFTDNNFTGPEEGPHYGSPSSFSVMSFYDFTNSKVSFIGNNFKAYGGDANYVYPRVSAYGNTIDSQFIFTDNNFTTQNGSFDLVISGLNGSNSQFIFKNNNFTTNNGSAAFLTVLKSNNVNITFIGNNISGTTPYAGVFLEVANTNNSQFTFTNNNIAGTSPVGFYTGEISGKFGDGSLNNSYLEFIFNNNNITGTERAAYINALTNNSQFTFTGNNFTGISYYGLYLSVYNKSNNNISFTNNIITGKSGYSISLSASNTNNTNITFSDNNITGSSYSVSFAAANSNNLHFTLKNNSIIGKSSYGISLSASNTNNNSQFIFANNNITGESGNGFILNASSSNNINIAFTENNIAGSTYGVNLNTTNSNNSLFNFTGNNIAGTSNGLNFNTSNSNNTNISFIGNDITGSSYSLNFNATNNKNSYFNFTRNNITATSNYGIHLIAPTSDNSQFIFEDNNITGAYGVIGNVFGSNNNSQFSFLYNNFKGTVQYGFGFNASNTNTINILLTENNITGSTYSIGLNTTNTNNSIFNFDGNNITGTNYSIVIAAKNLENSQITLQNNNITATATSDGDGINFDATNSKNSQITFKYNNITGTHDGALLYTPNSTNTNISFIENKIKGTNYGVGLSIGSTSNNNNLNFSYNNITGEYYGVFVLMNNTNGVSFINNIINSTNGDGFSFTSNSVTNISDFIVRGNTIYAPNGVGLNFSGLNTGSRVNVTVWYNRIIANTGVNITGFNDNSSFDYNWWGVNNITTKVLGIDTVNHYILKIINISSLYNLSFTDNASFAFLVLNTTLVNDGVGNLPYFIVNGTFNGAEYNTTTDDSFENNLIIFSSGYPILDASLDDEYVTFSLDINLTITVPPNVNIGENVTIIGQLDIYTGIDNINVTVDGKFHNVTVNSTTGGWNLNYTTNRTGNITITVSYIQNGTTYSINSTTFEVFKNSTNSTISVDSVHVGTDAVITGVLANYTVISAVNVTVDGKLYTDIVVDPTEGNWTVNHLTNHTGTHTVIVNYTELADGNYTSFINTSSFSVLRNSTNSSIDVSGANNTQIGTTATITGQLANFTVISSVNVTVDGKLYSDVVVDSVGGNWSVSHLTNHTGTYNVIVSYTESDSGNYTSFTNTTS
ncbi:hypothetical protein MARBORIA2_11820, partial [Methanobrevibacter arboriphilus]|uniref:beta strand repeat-containing protein n=1 Tax=Methanobrevibacter arboriphilus TaxID=39441 RepID=UPI0022EF1B6E